MNIDFNQAIYCNVYDSATEENYTIQVPEVPRKGDALSIHTGNDIYGCGVVESVFWKMDENNKFGHVDIYIHLDF